MKPSKPKVLFFDVNESLLDLKELKITVGQALNGREDLAPLWFSMLLHHSLVSTASNQFADFSQIAVATLQMVAAQNNIVLHKEKAKEVIQHFQKLSPHPEVEEALALLKSAGYQLVALTNSSEKGMNAQLRNAGISSFFDAQLSVETLGTYKPHKKVYQWAAEKQGVTLNECMLIAAHGWDVAGALWAGARAAFIARPQQELYPLAPLPEIHEKNLLDIAKKLIAMG